LLCATTSYAASSNDDLANAITITSLPFSHTISEAEAESNTLETNELVCSSSNLSWWYKITPTTSGDMTIVSGHSDNSLNCDIRLGVYTGTAHPLSQISCTDEDDGPGRSPYGENETISVTAGTTYYIRPAVVSTNSVNPGAVCKTDVTGTILSSGGGAVPVSANFGVGAGLAISLGVLGGVAAGIRRRRQKKLQIKN